MQSSMLLLLLHNTDLRNCRSVHRTLSECQPPRPCSCCYYTTKKQSCQPQSDYFSELFSKGESNDLLDEF